MTFGSSEQGGYQVLELGRDTPRCRDRCFQSHYRSLQHLLGENFLDPIYLLTSSYIRSLRADQTFCFLSMIPYMPHTVVEPEASRAPKRSH
jgi:hypothetical protein